MNKTAFAVAVATAVFAAGSALAANSVIGSYHSGMCLAISGNSAVTAKCNGSGNQVFDFSGYGHMKQGGNCLVSRGEGHPLGMERCDNAKKDQKWGFNGRRLNNEGGWCADIKGESKGAGAQVIAWKCKGSSNQQWRLGAIVSAKSVPGANPGLASSVQKAPPGSVFDVKSGRLIGQDGGSMVAAGGGNMVAAGGGNMVAAGGGNLIQFK